MTDIKELALRVAKEIDPHGYYNHDFAQEVSTKALTAYLAEQEPVAEVIGFFEDNKMPRVSWFDAYPNKGTQLFTAPPLPEPTPLDYWHQQDCNYLEKRCATPSKARAIEALDSMDDFARMADIDAIGPRKVLEDYINGVVPPSEEAQWIHHFHAIGMTQAADLIERLAARVPDGCVVVPKEQFETIQQAVIEMRHAFLEPNWFTDGKDGANRQFLLWSQKGLDAMKLIAAGEVKP